MKQLRSLGLGVGVIAMVAAATAIRVELANDALPILQIVAFFAGLVIAAATLFGLPGRHRSTVREPGGPDLWDRTGAWIAARGAPGALLLLTILIAVIHANVFRGEPYGDDLTFHMAESARLADCLRTGDFDFWNPSANGGYASAYYYQVLPQLASAIPSAIFGHHLFWFQLSVFLPLVLAPAAAYRGMRLLGATPWQAAAAAMCACLMNGESRWGSGNAGTFQVGLYTQTWALAAFPLALGHGIRWVRDGAALAPAIAWGTFVGLCHPFAGIALGLALFAGMIASRPATGFGLVAWYVRRRLRIRRRLHFPRPSPRAIAIARYAIAAVLILFGILLEFVELTGLPLLGEWSLGLRDENNPNVYVMPLLPVLAGIAMIVRTRRPADSELPTAAVVPDGAPVPREVGRILLLGLLLLVATLPGWITLVIDYKGFGGFPHRVNDEVGPGLVGLLVGRKDPSFSGYFQGEILDAGFGVHLLTWGAPLVLIFARDKILPWLWAPAFLFAALLALGPHLPATQDDLLPMVRFLGALQIVLALATGAGIISIGTWLCAQPEDARMIRGMRAVLTRLSFGRLWNVQLGYGVRTAVAALAAAGTVLLVAGGATSLGTRVAVLERDNPARIQMMTIIAKFRDQPQGRKMVGPGAENHWWNLLSYVYGKRPSLLQMGGGGLQASPNYDFLWTDHEFKKTAWTYNAPYLEISKAKSEKVADGEVVIETEEYQVRKLPAPGIVSPITITGHLPAGRKAAHAAALDWWKSMAPLGDQFLAYDDMPGAPKGTPLGTTLRAWEQPSPGDDPDVGAEVESMRPTTFVARMSWHPRWHVYIDGTEAPLRRVTPDFPAVDVPAGHHTLAFRFERPWWATASWLVWPGVVLGAWLVGRRRRRGRSIPHRHPAALPVGPSPDGRAGSRRPETA